MFSAIGARQPTAKGQGGSVWGVGSRYTVTTLDNIGDSDFVAVTKALQGSYRPLQNG
jgi:hypothetical protein